MEIRYIPFFKGVDLSERKLPILIERAKKPGKVIWLISGIHGDEFVGIPVIHRIFNYFKKNPLQQGTIFGVPMVNIFGFELSKRDNPYDNQDINRNFPGDLEGDSTERMCAAIFNNILKTRPALVLDIHSDTLNSIPYAIVDQPLSDEREVKKVVEESWQYAEKFGITVTFDIEASGYKKYQLDKSLTAALVNKAHIPAFLVELGGPNVLNESFIRIGTKGIKNILASLKMIKQIEPPWISETKIKTKKKLELLEDITSKESGLIEYFVEPGNFVKEGQKLAEIIDVFGKPREIIFAKRDSYIISLSDRAVSFPGSSICMVAFQKLV